MILIVPQHLHLFARFRPRHISVVNVWSAHPIPTRKRRCDGRHTVLGIPEVGGMHLMVCVWLDLGCVNKCGEGGGRGGQV